jgi:hypothetical protein
MLVVVRHLLSRIDLDMVVPLVALAALGFGVLSAEVRSRLN